MPGLFLLPREETFIFSHTSLLLHPWSGVWMETLRVQYDLTYWKWIYTYIRQCLVLEKLNLKYLFTTHTYLDSRKFLMNTRALADKNVHFVVIYSHRCRPVESLNNTVCTLWVTYCWYCYQLFYFYFGGCVLFYFSLSFLSKPKLTPQNKIPLWKQRRMKYLWMSWQRTFYPQEKNFYNSPILK